MGLIWRLGDLLSTALSYINVTVHGVILELYPFLVNICIAESSRFRWDKVNTIAAETLVAGVGRSSAAIMMAEIMEDK